MKISKNSMIYRSFEFNSWPSMKAQDKWDGTWESQFSLCDFIFAYIFRLSMNAFLTICVGYIIISMIYFAMVFYDVWDTATFIGTGGNDLMFFVGISGWCSALFILCVLGNDLLVNAYMKIKKYCPMMEISD